MQQLDSFTMAFMTEVVSVMLGILLLLAWLQNRSTRALLWWGVAFLVGAVGLALLMLRQVIGAPVSVLLGNALVILAYAVLWSGARLFDGRPVRPALLVAGPVFWLLLCQIPAFYTALGLRVLAASALLALYMGLAAFEVWRGRAEPLMSRWPTILVMGTNAAMFVARAVTTLVAPLPDPGVGPTGSIAWFTAVGFATLVYTIVLAFVLLMMTKERTELHHKRASLIDPLTGMANRRAFLESAEAALKGKAAQPLPMAVLLFDLDRFKEINDRFGHAVGDRVLRIFAEVVPASLGPRDSAGRLGGEEFAVMLQACDRRRAMAVAERIRERFAEEAVEVNGQPVLGTLSGGIALVEDRVTTIEELLARADGALYQAKRNGRDRVEVALRVAEMQAPETRPLEPEVIDAPSLVPALGRRIAVVGVDLKAAVRRVASGSR
jgi:diguanylate cyclase (GGDEF)-like protein